MAMASILGSRLLNYQRANVPGNWQMDVKDVNGHYTIQLVNLTHQRQGHPVQKPTFPTRDAGSLQPKKILECHCAIIIPTNQGQE